MRSRGWSGQWPASDEEAISRILDAADDIVAEHGATMRLTDVARALGVTRQTVYRYFPGPEAIVVACAMRAADGFIDQLAAHVRGLTDPVAAMVESVSYSVERLAGDRQFENLLTSRHRGDVTTSLTSETAMTFARSILQRFDIDWDQHGFDEAALDELAELSLRTMHSILVDPGQPPRDGVALRRFVARWLGPAILYPRLARAVDVISPRR
ncbi:TetR/AcrR family transcriptional regulator [Mycobacterium sp. SMC-8]|uniref:TetR/AcrR family transcriptional regulator n=1 Tax=Mycobacterium sp. SMC-8 TaxID=2857060 RepID=UPI0021B44222|nr:TetR/AcrR family transcriptional regulator [Mycobacterium sp. SMC-8]UXA13983.1 TetR/AcrR family transcriptional regulator [Mycobacterium sp. SMC-8]